MKNSAVAPPAKKAYKLVRTVVTFWKYASHFSTAVGRFLGKMHMHTSTRYVELPCIFINSVSQLIRVLSFPQDANILIAIINNLIRY